jgi:3',5'-cyclic AMP phosphodiesterase CpdA
LTDDERSLTLGENYSFIVVSDTHIQTNEDADVFALIKDHIGGAKFIVVTGDVTQHGTKEEIQKFITVSRTLGVPCYPVLGNHDIYKDRGAAWQELIGSSTYRIDAALSSTSLFILDNANASFGQDQLEWFENEIRSRKKHTFVFAHDNFFIEGSPPDYEHITDIRERARVMSTLKNRCDIMFMGHLHKRILKEFGGVQYIMIEDYGTTRTICRVHVSNEEIYYEFEKI